MFIHISDFFLTRETDFGKKLGLLAVRQNLKSCVPHEEWNLRPCGIHDFHNGGHRKSPGSSCMKTRSERPNYCVASLFVCYGEYFEYFKSDISDGERYTWCFSSWKKTWGVKKSQRLNFGLNIAETRWSEGMTTTTLVSGPNKGRNCFHITLNILLSLLMQSFSIEIFWQVATVTMRSCERLLLVDRVIYSLLAKAILLWQLCFFNRIGNNIASTSKYS